MSVRALRTEGGPGNSGSPGPDHSGPSPLKRRGPAPVPAPVDVLGADRCRRVSRGGGGLPFSPFFLSPSLYFPAETQQGKLR